MRSLVFVLAAMALLSVSPSALAVDEMYGFLERNRDSQDRLRTFDLTDGDPMPPPAGATPWLVMNQFGLDFTCDGTLWGFGQINPAGSGGTLREHLFQVDLATGDLVVVDGPYAGLGLGGHGFEFGPDGVPYLFSLNQLYRVETGPAALVPVGPTHDTRHSNLALGPDGRLYTVGVFAGGGGPNSFMTVDPADGSLTVLGTTDVPRVSTLEFTPDGSLYGYCYNCTDDVGAGDRTMVRMDPATGARIATGSLNLPNGRIRGMAWGPDAPIGCGLVCDEAAASIAELWPPNHRMVQVGVDGIVSLAGEDVSILIDAVFQDEPTETEGDGAFAPDAIIDENGAWLRAERSGLEDGRVYHVSYTATDAAGNSCSGTVTVCVPHDRGRGSACVDQGPLHDSTLAP